MYESSIFRRGFLMQIPRKSVSQAGHAGNTFLSHLACPGQATGGLFAYLR